MPFLAASSLLGQISVWDTDSNSLIARINGSEYDKTVSFCFSPDGSRLALVDNLVQIFDLSNLRVETNMITDLATSAVDVDFINSSLLLQYHYSVSIVYNSNGNGLLLYQHNSCHYADLVSKKVLWSSSIRLCWQSAVFSADDSFLFSIVGGRNNVNNVTIIEAKSGRSIFSCSTDNKIAVHLALSSDQQTVATGGDKFVCLWNVSMATDGNPTLSLRGKLFLPTNSGYPTISLGFADDIRLIVGAYDRVMIWNSVVSEVLHSIQFHQCLRGLSYCAQLNRVACLVGDSDIDIFDLENYERVARIEYDACWMAYSPASSVILL